MRVRLDVEVVVPLRHDFVHEVRERARGLDAGRPGADDHEVQGAGVDELVVRGRFLEELEHAAPQLLRVGHRVQGEGVLGGAWRVEEVGLRARGDDDVVAGERLAVGGGDRAGLGVDPRHVELTHRDARVLGEDRADRPGDVGGSELGGGDLVQQRLELLVVVPVDQRHGHVVLRRAPSRTRRRRSRRRRSRPWAWGIRLTSGCLLDCNCGGRLFGSRPWGSRSAYGTRRSSRSGRRAPPG